MRNQLLGGSPVLRRRTSTSSAQDLGLYLGLHFRVRHCRTPPHDAWQELYEFRDWCLRPAIRWLAVSESYYWIPLKLEILHLRVRSDSDRCRIG